MNKIIKFGLPIILVISAFSAYLIVGGKKNSVNKNLQNSNSSKQVDDNKTQTETLPAKQNVQTGRYTTYSEAKLAEVGYDSNIVFFFAPWCPECRAFKQEINAGSIPKGVQILEADYDSSTDLKGKYGVTLQSTFVKVNDSGDLVKKWVGYGKDKSLSNVLGNLK